MTNRVTAKQLVDIILGKEMSTTEIWEAVKAAHPANTMTRQELALRLRSMIRSPDVKITKKGCGPRALYKLTSVSDKFVERAEVNYRANPVPARRIKRCGTSTPKSCSSATSTRCLIRRWPTCAGGDGHEWNEQAAHGTRGRNHHRTRHVAAEQTLSFSFRHVLRADQICGGKIVKNSIQDRSITSLLCLKQSTIPV